MTDCLGPDSPRCGELKTYRHGGCRGVHCKEAQRVAGRKYREIAGTSNKKQKAWRLRKHEQHREHPERTPHGKLSGYTDYGCRCRPCTDAASDAVRKWREKKNEA